MQSNASASALGGRPPSRPQSYNFKVVLLGEGCVGKTSLVLRYVEDQFNAQHISTLQASFLNRKLNIDGKRVSLSIWDTAGQERFHALGPIYYRSSNGALLVYDVTDGDSFRKVKNWVVELQRQLGTDIVLTIVGNKIDLLPADDAEALKSYVRADQAEAYAQSVGARHFRTSAKENVGIEELFYELAHLMMEASDAISLRQNQQNGSDRTSSSAAFSRRNGGGLRVEGADDDDEGRARLGDERRTGSWCCSGGSGGDAADRG